MNVSACFRWSGWARSSAAVLRFALAAFVACSSDDPPSDEPAGDPADCRLIANRCHSYAPESELADECHETGHDAVSPERCTELKASCLDECPPRDPDSGVGGSSGATSSGGSSGTTSGGNAGTSAGGASGEAGATGNGGTAGEATGGASGSSSGGSSSGGSAGSSQGGTAGSTGSTGTAGSAGSGVAGMAGGSGSGGTSGETPCELLGRICHDVGAGRPEECHEIGHDGDESVCEEELEECLAVCQDGGM